MKPLCKYVISYGKFQVFIILHWDNHDKHGLTYVIMVFVDGLVTQS